MTSEPISHLTPSTPPLAQRDDSVAPPPGFDPLRLCVNTTVSVISLVLGPIAVLGFALLAISAYARARRAGVMRSRCKLGDTRIVLAYLGVIAILAAAAIPFWVLLWVRVFSG